MQAKKRILFLADRNILVDQTMQQDFAPFGEVMHKVTNREVKKKYEIYLALYQAVTGREEWKQIYRQFPADFFDLIVVDEANAYKNPQTKRWKVLNRLVTPETWLWMLTGTPASQSPLDAYGLAKLVSPDRVPKYMTPAGIWSSTKLASSDG